MNAVRGPAYPWIPSLLMRMRHDPLQFFANYADEYGPLVRLPLGISDFYLINDPDVIRDILVTQSPQFEKFPRIPPSHGLFGNGLLTSEGDLHHRQRRMTQPAFRRERIDTYARVMVESAAALADSWSDGEEIDVAGAMNKLALDIVSKALFSTDTRRYAAEIGSAIHEILPVLNRLIMPFGETIVAFPTPAHRRYRAALRRLDEIVMEMIQRRRGEEEGSEDLLSLLIGSQEDGVIMSDRQLRDEVITIFVAGHETTANALAWTWYLLSQNPAAADLLDGELRQLAGCLPTVADLQRLVVTESVAAESLRLCPAVWILGRRALSAYRFQSMKARKHSVFLICSWVLHRRPEIFPDPTQFNLQHWTPEARQNRPKYGYLPFGAGARLCIGERFAWMEQMLVVATIARRWRLELAPGQRVEPEPMLTLRPKYGLRMIARRV